MGDPGGMLSPQQNSSVPVLEPNWREMIPERRTTTNTNRVHAQEIIKALPVKFAWRQTGVKPYTLQISTQADFADCQTVTVNNPEAEVYNLFTGTQYFCRVLDSRKEVIATGKFGTNDTPRWIHFPETGKAPLNFRDLGSWRTADGNRVKQGMVYRGADLQEWLPVSEKNQQFMTQTLKIKSEIDMRYADMVKDKQRSRLDENVKLFFRPVNAYQSFTPDQCDLFRDTIKVFADAANYPIYFHCSGGVDRTGEIAFLINALLGVPEEQLFEDYELSSLSLFPRTRDIAYFKEWRGKIATYAPAGSDIQKQVENYLLAIGVTAGEIQSIRRIMLEK